jgi:tetratricopeptide (TPR) repeat protein
MNFIRGIKTKDRNRKGVSIDRILSIFILGLMISSCVGGSVKQDANNDISDTVEYVDVDSDVEQDFISASALLQQGDNEQAITILKSIIEREQRLPAPYVNLAIAYNRMGDKKAAEENLISALKLDIGHPVANNELGLLYRKEGKFNAARTAYENAIKKHPEYLPARKNLGVLCDLYTHDFSCALEQFEDYLELRPEDKEVEIWVADLKRRIGR